MSTGKPRILMANNYDMPLQRRLWLEDEGRRPNHHLWATVQLEAAGYPTAIIPFEPKTWLARASEACRILGDLGQQWYAITHMGEYDVLYAAHQNPLLLLALARRFGLFPKPIISVLHRSYGRSPAARLFVGAFLRGYDTLMTVTREIATAMRANGTWREERLAALPWGLDIPAFDRAISGVETDGGADRHFMSTGKTHRDFRVLVEAFRRVPDAALRVYHGTDNQAALAARDRAGGLGREAAGIAFHQLCFNDWREIARINKRAYAVLVGLDLAGAAPYANGFGLTALLDAMAAGRPIVITRTRYPVIDVEREGIGLFVDGANPEAWADAIRFLVDNPEEAEAIGRRARRLCETTYNIETYATGVMRRIDRIGAGSVSAPAVSPIHG